MFFKKKTDLGFVADAFRGVNELLGRVRRSKAVGELTHVNLKDLKCTRVQLRADYSGSLKPTQLTVVLTGLHHDSSFGNIPRLMMEIQSAAAWRIPEELRNSVNVVLAREERK